MIALFGPTGVGKTAVALALAECLRALGETPVAVSADALQVYAGLEILTGAASAQEQAVLEHRLLSFLPVGATFSAGQYAEQAHAEIDGLLAAGARPIVVGGTGLYLRAALTQLSLRPAAGRGGARALAGRAGTPRARGAARDPGPARALGGPRDRPHRPPADRPRARAAGERRAHAAPARSQLWSSDVRHPTLLAGLTMDRAALYARIDARVDAMLAAGVAG